MLISGYLFYNLLQYCLVFFHMKTSVFVCWNHSVSLS